MSLGRFGELLNGPHIAEGWQLKTLVQPSRLVGANGMRFGPDGRLYVAQAFGGQISAYNLDTSETQIVSGADGQIIAPDDLAFDSKGNLFATEVMSARVSARRANGDVQVIADNVPVANGIVVHNDRIFMSEFNPEGRILELFADGSAPRIIANNLMMPNALSMGPDNHLYFPLVPLGEVWRVHVDGGQPERVAGEFNIPTAVKFSPDGNLVIVESGTGDVTSLDVFGGGRSRLGRTDFGIDNLVFSADGRLFVSHFTDGGVVEITTEGSEKQLIPGGMLGPFGLGMNADGKLVIADGMSIATVSSAGLVRRPAMLLEHGFPGYVRGIAVEGSGSYICSNSAGVIARYQPGAEAEIIASELDELMGVSILPNGNIVVAEAGAGSVWEIDGDNTISHLVQSLQRPTGVHACDDGSILITDAADGRVIRLKDGVTDVLLEGLSEPHGITEIKGNIFVVDRGSHRLIRFDSHGGDIEIVAHQLPVGISGEMRVNTLPGIKDLMPGPLLPFSDLVAMDNGAICLGGDEDGSILMIQHSL